MNQFKNQTKFDINDIIKVLPHRYPFILIDRIEITNPGERLVALKNLTINEPFFQGTFPRATSDARRFIIRNNGTSGFIFNAESRLKIQCRLICFFQTVEKAKFRKPIVPGDQLTVYMRLIKKKLNLCKFHGVCKVDDEVVADAVFSANLVDRARE